MIDYWPVPCNIATETAHKIMQDFREKRFKKHEAEEAKKRKWPAELKCCKCRSQSPSEEMKHVMVISRRQGKRLKYWRHYCENCKETYKPNSKRVGGKNY